MTKLQGITLLGSIITAYAGIGVGVTKLQGVFDERIERSIRENVLNIPSYDLDQNGGISVEEAKAIVDKDSDGKLSNSEIRSSLEICQKLEGYAENHTGTVRRNIIQAMIEMTKEGEEKNKTLEPRIYSIEQSRIPLKGE